MPDVTIDSLQIEIESNSASAVKGIDALSASLGKLRDAVRGGLGLSAVSSEISKISSAFSKMSESNLAKVTKLSQGIGSSASFNSTGAIEATNRLSAANDKAAKSYVNLSAKIGISIVVLRKITNIIGSWINKSNKYIEDINLFNASMGKFAEQAQNYAEQVGEVMGIDPGEWMRNQGLFMTLASGFGVISDRAYTMSKNLTQLGYDISSFFNLSVDESMRKLQSGLAGELEPLRRIGYDLSIARLEQEAYVLGIEKTVSAMTQAEKAELRYYTIMRQVTTVQGDMSRTLDAPANQLRILKAQLDQTARSLGNIFIPMLNAVLPYAIAFAKVIRLLATEIASLFGFSIPEVDYSGLEPIIGGEIEESLDDASGAAKELKNNLLGIDELNILSPSSGGGGLLSGVGGGSGFEFDLPEYDFLGDALTQRTDKIFKSLKKSMEPFINFVKENFEIIRDIVLAIATALLTWKITSSITDFFSKLGLLGGTQSATIALGLTLMVTGWSLAFSGAKELGRGEADVWSYVKMGLGSALGIAGSLLVFGTGPLGWTIGILGSLAVLIAGVTIGAREKLQEEYNNSEIAKIIAGYKERIEKANEINIEIQANIGLRAEAVSNVETQLLVAQELIDKIYMLAEKPDKSSGDLAILQSYINELNKMDLGDLKLEYDELTGEINLSKQEALKLLAAQKELMMQEVYSEVLQGAYKDLIIAQKNSLDLETDLNDLGIIREGIYGNIKTLGSEANALYSEADRRMKAGLPVLDDQQKRYFDINHQIELEKLALSDVNTQIENATKEHGNSLALIQECEQEVGYYEQALGGVFGTVQTTNEEGLKDTKKTITDSANFADTKISEVNKKLATIKTPKQYLEFDTTAITEMQKALNLISVPDLKMNLEVSTIIDRSNISLDLADRQNWPKIEMYAAGGYPQEGTLFIAQEAGPELVGSIGGHTAVTNNDQIVESVSQGVYQAVIAAMSASNNSNSSEVYVYLDGKQITSAVEQRQRDRGISIMSGVYNPV